MPDSEKITIDVLNGLSDISANDWDACVCHTNGCAHDPFTTHRFLKALEDSGSVGAGTGWQPHHLVARQGDQVIAVMPFYAKSHSQGEYIFDHNWAHAYENAGGRYYPKLQSAIPFTPVTGSRFLCREGYEMIGKSALAQGAIQVTVNNQLSSFHMTFCTEEEFEVGHLD